MATNAKNNSRFRDDLNSLDRRDKPSGGRLSGAPQPNAGKPVVSRGLPSGAGVSEGIASPLSETGRSYYDPVIHTSSDGVYVVEYQPIRSITLKDAKGATVVVNYEKPT